MTACGAKRTFDEAVKSEMGQLQPYATPQKNAHKENFSPKLSVQ